MLFSSWTLILLLLSSCGRERVWQVFYLPVSPPIHVSAILDETLKVSSPTSLPPTVAGGHSFSFPLTISIPRIVCHSIYWLVYCDSTHTCPCPGSCAPQHTCGSQRSGGGVASFPPRESGSARVVGLGAVPSDGLSQPTHPALWILFHNEKSILYFKLIETLMNTIHSMFTSAKTKQCDYPWRKGVIPC